MPPRLPFVIGILVLCVVNHTSSRASTRVRLPMPTSETIPYVAEVMGATSYEESIEEGSGEVKRVQRKLAGPQHKEQDLDREEQYAEYQGVIGRPGVDFPVLPGIPRTDFNCRKVKSSGYYADLDTGCQVFHICDGGRKISFLCPNGTIFRQSHLICDWWFRVDCERSVEQYEESAEQLAHDQMIYKKRAEEIAKAMTSRIVSTEKPRFSTTTFAYNQPQVQQRSRQTPRPPPIDTEQVEHERQVPAETASFVSNKHRFGNQLENQYRLYLATSSTTPPPFRNGLEKFEYRTEQYQNNQGRTQGNFENRGQKTKENYQFQSSYNNNNFPTINKANYESKVESEFSSTTTNYNFPSSSSYSPVNVNDNFQLSESKNNLPLENNNYYNQNSSPSTHKSYNNNPNRGNVNYFNSNFGNNNAENSQKYISSIPNFNESSADNSKASVTSQKYVDYSSVETRPVALQRQSTTLNDYTPLASTTLRSVTGKISSFNDHSARSEKYKGIKQKPIFNVKIKPTKDTKDIAYVELLRHEEEKKNVYTVTPETYSSPISSFDGPSHTQTFSKVETSTSAAPSTVTESKSRNAYLPKVETTNKKEDSIRFPVEANRYASINISGRSEEIRPEIVNALMESGVTPTSAKALHSLASYISSGAADEDYAHVFNDGNHPHVSDVILNFRSGSPVNVVSDSTTNTPLTSSDEILPSVLTKATKESYSYLFSDSKEQTDTNYGERNSPVEVEISTPKPRSTTQVFQTPTIISKQEPREDLKLKDSSELRELAQVFSRALSAYLEDPETFKEILAQVRPTEPNVDNTTPSVEDEVLDFSDAMLGRLGTTLPPVTSLGNSDYVEDNLSIGDINSLANGKSYEEDNSLEINTFPPTAPEALQDNQYSSVTPKLLLFNPKNNSQIRNYYSKLGSAEDESYFPTLGGVSDTSRPRYGGFQNNTGKTQKSYSPYGSDLPKNITGVPISSPRTPATTQNLFNKKNVSSTAQIIPEPHDVNSLIKSNILNADHASSEESPDIYQTSPSFLEEDSYYSPADQEKVLVASGSQSLVSSNNYVQFAKKFNEQQIQEGKKTRERFHKTKQQESSPSPLPSLLSSPEDLTPYFGQEPPFENLGVPSGFKAQEPVLNADPVNYHIGSTTKKLGTPAPLVSSSNSYEASYGSTSSLVSSSHSGDQIQWTVSPIFDTSSAGTSVHLNLTQKPTSTSHSPNQFHPTTYHPPHSSESLEVTDNQWESTLRTESTPDTTPIYDTSAAGTTLTSEEQNLTEAAKEMFGMLNETMAMKLMDMIAQGESNMTIRRLVLLLVNSKGNDNVTIQEKRESLINALLTNTKEPMTTVPVQPVTTPSTTQAPRKKVRVSRVRVSTSPPRKAETSGKSYRGTDSMTAVHGSAPSPSDLNKINSAKLYIPTPSASALTSSKLPLDSDARAVELLKTLYSLAAKWG